MKTGRYLFFALQLLLIGSSFIGAQLDNESPPSVVNDDEKNEALDTAKCNATVTQEKDLGTVAVDTKEKELKGTGAVDTSTKPSNGLADDAELNTNEVKQEIKEEEPVQAGPFIDLFGTKLLSLNRVDETHAEMELKYTNDVLSGKKVVGIYFSADWCGPCRQFTPELVSFYNKMNGRRGKKDEFEIVWVSSCRDMQSFGQYFTHMNWVALPPEEATGQRGKMLASKYKVKGIPHLALLDEVGNVITLDGRTKIPQDRAGLGFPWRNPLSTLYVTLIPQSLRFILRSQVNELKGKVLNVVKGDVKQQVMKV